MFGHLSFYGQNCKTVARDMESLSKAFQIEKNIEQSKCNCIKTWLLKFECFMAMFL
jgi:hypothetical protein